MYETERILNGPGGSLTVNFLEQRHHRSGQCPKFCVWIGFTWVHFLESERWTPYFGQRTLEINYGGGDELEK